MESNRTRSERSKMIAIILSEMPRNYIICGEKKICVVHLRYPH